MRKILRPNITIVLVIFLISLGVSYCENYTPPAADFTIVYSSDVLGETEPCG